MNKTITPLCTMLRTFFIKLIIIILATQTASAENLLINEKLIGIEHELNNVTNIVEQENNIQGSIESLLLTIPTSETVLAQKNNQLEKNPPDGTSQFQISDIDKLLHKLNVSQDSLQKRLETLTQTEIKLDHAKQQLEEVAQLLSNPQNIETLSIQSHNKKEQLDTTLSQLYKQHEIKIESLSLLSEKLDSSVVRVNQWKSTLSRSLIQENSNNLELLKENTGQELLVDKIADLRSELGNVKNTDDIEKIKILQKEIYEKKMLLWLENSKNELFSAINTPVLTISENTRSSLPLSDLEEQKGTVSDIEKRLYGLSSELLEKKNQYQKHADIVGTNEDVQNAFKNQQIAIEYQQLLLSPISQQLNTLINDEKQQALLNNNTFTLKGHFKQALNEIPTSLIQIAYQVQISIKTLITYIRIKPAQTLLFFIIVMLTVFGIIQLVKKWFAAFQKNSFTNSEKIESQLDKLRFVFNNVNIALITLLSFSVFLIRLSDIPYPSNHIVRVLLYSTLYLLLWLPLIYYEFKHNMYTYSQVITRVLIGLAVTILAALFAFAYMSSVDQFAIILYEKALMVAIVVFSWIERHHLLQFFTKNDEENTSKIRSLFLKVINLLPLSIIFIACVNFVGYSQLAWQLFISLGIGISYCLCVFVGVFLIKYWRKKTKLAVLKQFRYGAFIASDIVSPLSTVSKLLWVWFITKLLFNILHWDKDTFLISKFLHIVQYPIITIGETVINLQVAALSVLSIYIIFKVARWLKTFSYQWLYSRINDLGVRGSLSIFTQYVAVFIGVLIALKLLGIDLTSLAVFAGALGVGVGLGLQDIAKNFISGILLLIERPLRNGDWVMIDGNEGTVKSIGMRAITMETFDRQEVIIPNGSAISNSFVNNTHSNSLLRTVLYVGAGYDADPHEVLQLLQDILENTEHILSEPAPRAVLWEYGDSSINYRIQYFIDTDDSGLFLVRTSVLSQIWHTFKKHNIEIPFPQRDINFRNTVRMITHEDE